MKELLSDRINNLSESQTIAMSRMSRELQAQGIDVISLSAGEPDFDTPDFIKQVAKQAIDDNYSHYMPVPGYLDLCEGICEKFKRDNNLEYSPQQIVVSTGAKHTIANACLCLLNDGDEALIPAPYWVTYVEQVKLAGAKPVIISASIEADFKITPEQLEESITEKTKLLIFSSPCNPSGSIYSEEELKALAEVIAKHPTLFVIADEIYEHINFVGKHASIGQFIYDQTITVNGVSKGFAMTGWRIGYMGAPKWIAAACNKLQGQFTSGASSIAQRAALAAVKADPSVTSKMLAAFRKRKDLVLELLKDIPDIRFNEPQGAFYVFPDVSVYFGKSDGETTINNATDLCMYLLNKANVGLVTGEAFGSPNNIRLSYSTSEQKLIEAIRRVKEALAELK
ncbi:pyridoxal phosphate-dependent aminotransferase [Bacteroidales bacterium AH-315-I05]|nr:pyridoxal phosphate-dependent aminotransferase [Bacteroidales bacterium AH-315-I05]